MADGFRRMGIGIMEGYGLTETSPLLTMCEAFAEEPGMVAVDGVSVRIDHPDENGVGEIMAYGPNIMAGYYKNPEATAEVIDADGWFHTGDLGTYKDGRLLISGRAKNVIVLETGENVYPEEVEWELINIPAVEEIMVHEGQRQGVPAVCAQIYPDWTTLKGQGIEDASAALEHIWEAIRERGENLATFKRIKSKECITLVDQPFEKSGKLDIKRHLHRT
jgi:long-chain acyl-CoA synthetase